MASEKPNVLEEIISPVIPLMEEEAISLGGLGHNFGQKVKDVKKTRSRYYCYTINIKSSGASLWIKYITIPLKNQK